MRSWCLALGLLLLGAPAAAQESEPSDPAVEAPPAVDQGDWVQPGSAVLQGLDKITARISTFDAPLEAPVRFGSLEIVIRACYKRPPEDPPESAAFLEIVDVRPDSPAVPVFTGWMFASSPALSAIEHPVYDVWVIDCKKRSNSASSNSP